MKNILDIDRWEEIIITIIRNKTRSLLTAFGVFWGIFMLVFLIGGGKGLETIMSNIFTGVASNSCLIMSNRTSEAYKGFRKGRYWDLTTDDIYILKKNVQEIEYITPILFGGWGDNNVVYGDKTYKAGIKGVFPDYDKIETQKVEQGRYINEIDIRDQRKVCCIGVRIYETLFKRGEDPIGKYIRVDGIYYQIAGVIKGANNMSIGGNSEEMVVLPFTTMQKAYRTGKTVHMIGMTSKPKVPISIIEEKVTALIKQNHMIAPHDAQAVFTMNVEKIFKQFEGLSIGISLLIWIVGLGTLFAGIIGVSNIMMVTVKERTGEIGIRRAIGAKPRNILNQILSESMLLTYLAGMSGVCFGVLLLELFNVVFSENMGFDIQMQISFGLAVGTTILLLTLGSLAGLAPAYRAMAIKPIEAIREE